jgi:integrase
MPQRETKALTNIRINALKPEPRDYEIFDRNVGGLAVRVFPSGRKSFVVNFRVNEKRKRMTIGNPSVMSITDARQEALELQQRAKAGTNIVQEKKDKLKAKVAEQARDENTLAYQSELFIERHCIKDRKLKGKTWKEYRRILNKYVLPQLGDRNPEDVKRTDMTALLDHVADNHGPYQANRVLSTTRKLFNWLCVRGEIDVVPFVIGMARREYARTRYLNDAEIVQFWEGCEKLKYPYGKIFQLLLLTGTRKGEVTNMRWSQIDMTQKIWKLPSHSTKMERPHLVPLSAMAIDILEMMPKFPDTDLVFPTELERDRPVSNHGHAKKKVCELETHWQPHDLRRTLETNLIGKLKVDYHIAKKVTGHIDQTVSKHYDQHDYVDEKRDALEAWGKRLTSILSKNVVDLDTKRA